MNKKSCHNLLLVLLILLPLQAFVQESKISLNGYLKELFLLYYPETAIPGTRLDFLSSDIIHNRLNFKWYASKKLTTVLEMRNRMMMGNMINNLPGYREMVNIDYGLADLSWIPAQGNGWFIHSMIDRAYLDYSSGKWQIRAGRQRINWGMNLIWNPNDIFNSFSYFDIDYEERSGTDALHVQYYAGVTSSAELVYKPGHDSIKSAAAGIYRFSKWNYDFQLIGGQAGDDWILGAGWAGDILGAGFRGELTHFEPQTDNSERATIASASADYTFSNSWYIHFSALYNSTGKTGKAGGTNLFFNPDMTARHLSAGRYALFGQFSKPITPLCSGSLSGILNPLDSSFYVGPALTYSLLNNLEIMIAGQLFFGNTGTEYGDIGQVAIGRIKWSF